MTISTPSNADIIQNVELALAEDIGDGDITANLIPENKKATATLITREDAVLCGTPWFNATFQKLDPSIELDWHYQEGQKIPANAIICEIKGPARAILTAERTAINFLQTLSGTATITNQMVDALSSTSTKLLDTRKTIPGLRMAQKYAVSVGGGTNHRKGLYDAFLIKENHIMAAGGIQSAVKKARMLHSGKTIEVEVENLDELKIALKAGADIIMLDNFSLQDLKSAVKINNNQAKLEVSGNVAIENLHQLATLGVDYISTGSLTKHIRAIDFSLRIILIDHEPTD